MIGAFGSFVLTLAFIVLSCDDSERGKNLSRGLLTIAAVCFFVNFLGFLL